GDGSAEGARLTPYDAFDDLRQPWRSSHGAASRARERGDGRTNRRAAAACARTHAPGLDVVRARIGGVDRLLSSGLGDLQRGRRSAWLRALPDLDRRQLFKSW